MEENNNSPVTEDEQEEKVLEEKESMEAEDSVTTDMEKQDSVTTNMEADENDVDNMDELREQARKKAEKQQQKIREKEIKSGKKCRIAGIVAAIAGVLEVYFGFSAGSATSMCIGVAFICAGYFYYNMGKRLDRKYHVSQ